MNHNFEGYLVASVEFLCKKDKLEHTVITCRCKNSFTAYVPRELFDGGAIPLLECPKCGQEYVIYQKRMYRAEDFKTVEGVVIPKSAKGKRMQPTSRAEN